MRLFLVPEVRFELTATYLRDRSIDHYGILAFHYFYGWYGRTRTYNPLINSQMHYHCATYHGAGYEIRTHYLFLTKEAFILMNLTSIKNGAEIRIRTENLSLTRRLHWPVVLFQHYSIFLQLAPRAGFEPAVSFRTTD